MTKPRRPRESAPETTNLNVDTPFVQSAMLKTLNQVVDERYPQMINMAQTIFNDCLDQHRPFGVAIATTYESLRGYLKPNTEGNDLAFSEFESMLWDGVKENNQKIADQASYDRQPIQSSFIRNAKPERLDRLYARNEREPFVVESTRQLGQVATTDSDMSTTPEEETNKELELWREPNETETMFENLSIHLASKEPEWRSLASPDNADLQKREQDVSTPTPDKKHTKERHATQRPYQATNLGALGESRLYAKPGVEVTAALDEDSSSSDGSSTLEREEDAMQHDFGHILISNKNGTFMIDGDLLIQTYDKSLNKQPKRRSIITLTSLKVVVGQLPEFTYEGPADVQLVNAFGSNVENAHVLLSDVTSEVPVDDDKAKKRTNMWNKATDILHNELKRREELRIPQT